MKTAPISEVHPMWDGILQVVFETGNTVMVDMKPRYQAVRFYPLQEPAVWASAETDGHFIRWRRDRLPVAELAYEELMRMLVGKTY